MAQLTPIGLVKIMGHVFLILLIPMVGGAVAGIVLDAILGTSPICVLSGFGVGNVIAIAGIWRYIRHGQRLYGSGRAQGIRRSPDH